MLDFDGTICRGDAPVRDYAQAVAADLDDVDAHRLTAAIDAFLTGSESVVIHDAKDGYDAVTRLALRAGLDRDHVRDAFLNTRQKLTDGELPIEIPANLTSFLHKVSVNARTVVVTNAPKAGLDKILERMGVGHLIDSAIGDAGKPDRMPTIVDALLSDIDAGQMPWRLLSAGDIWENDLRVPWERGCVTAYVDRFSLNHGRPSAAGGTIEELYKPIRHWAAEMSDDALRQMVYPHLSGR